MVELASVQGKCSVVCAEDLNESVEEYSAKGTHRFYFREVGILYPFHAEELERLWNGSEAL